MILVVAARTSWETQAQNTQAVGSAFACRLLRCEPTSHEGSHGCAEWSAVGPALRRATVGSRNSASGNELWRLGATGDCDVEHFLGSTLLLGHHCCRGMGLHGVWETPPG